MSGSMHLYISSTGVVHKIPNPHYSNYKPVPSLANQEVLVAVLLYKTLNRKPFKLELVSFHRGPLNNDGVLQVINNEDILDTLLFSSPDSLALQEDPIRLPTVPTNIPSNVEKKALYNYIKEKYPALWSNCQYLVEQHCIALKNNFDKEKNIVKRAFQIKKNTD